LWEQKKKNIFIQRFQALQNHITITPLVHVMQKTELHIWLLV